MNGENTVNNTFNDGDNQNQFIVNDPVIRNETQPNLINVISPKNFNRYKIAEWNANGWKSARHPDNIIFQQNIVKQLNFDIWIFPETHCLRVYDFTFSDFPSPGLIMSVFEVLSGSEPPS